MPACSVALESGSHGVDRGAGSAGDSNPFKCPVSVHEGTGCLHHLLARRIPAAENARNLPVPLASLPNGAGIGADPFVSHQ